MVSSDVTNSNGTSRAVLLIMALSLLMLEAAANDTPVFEVSGAEEYPQLNGCYIERNAGHPAALESGYWSDLSRSTTWYEKDGDATRYICQLEYYGMVGPMWHICGDNDNLYRHPDFDALSPPTKGWYFVPGQLFLLHGPADRLTVKDLRPLYEQALRQELEINTGYQPSSAYRGWICPLPRDTEQELECRRELERLCLECSPNHQLDRSLICGWIQDDVPLGARYRSQIPSSPNAGEDSSQTEANPRKDSNTSSRDPRSGGSTPSGGHDDRDYAHTSPNVSDSSSQTVATPHEIGWCQKLGDTWSAVTAACVDLLEERALE